MTELVPVAWVLFALGSWALFGLMGSRRAALICVWGGWALLPTAWYAAGVEAETFPSWIIGTALPSEFWITKATVIGAVLMIGVLLFDRASLRRFRPRWRDAAVTLWCLMPLVSSLSNGSGFVDGVQGVFCLAITWGMMWIAGRLYFGDAPGLATLLRGMVVGGLFYIPVALIEWLSGPVLYGMVYGFHPYRFDGAERYLGHRGIGFLEHGNQMGMWLAGSALAAAWLARSNGREGRIGRLSMKTCAIALVVATLLSQSMGAILLLAAALGALEVGTRVRGRWIAAGMLAVIGLYVVVRLTNVAPVIVLAEKTWFGQIAKQMLKQGGRGSLGWRLKMEEVNLKRVMERPIAGWGQTSWWDPNQTRPWGLWMLALGMYGLVGLGLMAWVLGSGAVEATWRCPAGWASRGEWGVLITASAVLGLHILDALFNSTLIMPVIMVAGGIASVFQRPFVAGQALVPENSGGAAAARSMWFAPPSATKIV